VRKQEEGHHILSVEVEETSIGGPYQHLSNNLIHLIG